jgi:hypothetical protein
VGQFEPGSPISRLGREPDWQAMVIDHLKMNAGPATFGAQVQAARGLLGWTRARLSNARKRRGALLPHQAPDRAARADRYTERVEVLLLASDGKSKHPAGPPMTLDTCGPSDGAIRTAVPGGKVMEWFSRRTSIAGTQIPNWVLVLGVVIAFFLIYELIT